MAVLMCCNEIPCRSILERDFMVQLERTFIPQLEKFMKLCKRYKDDTLYHYYFE